MKNTQSLETAVKQVLLVDDNQVHQYSLGRHLTDSGFVVMHAHSGAETFAAISTQLPDVILLDINLPDTLGFDICRALKADAKTTSIPVIFHSATHDTQYARSSAQDLGAFSFLSYPIDVDHLINVIHGAIARSSHDLRPKDD